MDTYTITRDEFIAACERGLTAAREYLDQFAIDAVRSVADNAPAALVGSYVNGPYDGAVFDAEHPENYCPISQAFCSPYAALSVPGSAVFGVGFDVAAREYAKASDKSGPIFQVRVEG